MAHIQIDDLTPRNQYTATASQTTFTYSFPIFVEADIKVYVGSTLKTLTTDYTVTGEGTNSGGTVVFNTGLSAGDIVTLYRDVAVKRTTDYQSNGDLTAQNLNDDLDKIIAMVQQIEFDLNNRCLRFGQFTTGIPLSEFTESATDRANKVLAFDSAGDANITQELGTYQGTDATTTTAAYVARDIVKSTTAGQLNNIYICLQASPVGTALTDTSYWALIVDAVSASAAQTAAEAAQTAAEAAQTAAELAETNAETAETNAETAEANALAHKNAAETAKTAAEAAQAAAEAALDEFDDKYLGAKASDPTLDNDGDPLTIGDFYFNTVTLKVRFYNGSSWDEIDVTASSTTTFTNKTLADFSNTIHADMVHVECRNNTGSTIPALSVVRLSGAISSKPTIALADASTEVTSADTIGVTAEAINNNTEGMVALQGVVTGLDTSAFTDGDTVYLSETAGGLTTTKPATPAHLVVVGRIIYAHNNAGIIFVTVQNGWEMDELHDVLITSIATGEILKWDGSKWINNTLTEAGIQAYDADTAKLDTTQAWTKPQRSTDTVDNDGSFDLNVNNHFKCTPTGAITLTFTNIPAGQSGTVLLDNTGGQTISAAATTKVMGADFLTTVSTAGIYMIGYRSDGTNVRVYNSGAQQ